MPVSGGHSPVCRQLLFTQILLRLKLCGPLA
jgi:hypothetical protein